MNKEEKEAIKSLKNIAENAVEYDYLNWEEIDAVKTVLNLIQKQSKIIDKMAEILEDLQIAHFKKDEYGGFYGYRTYNKEDWKEYFKKVVDKYVKD